MYDDSKNKPSTTSSEPTTTYVVCKRALDQLASGVFV